MEPGKEWRNYEKEGGVKAVQLATSSTRGHEELELEIRTEGPWGSQRVRWWQLGIRWSLRGEQKNYKMETEKVAMLTGAPRL